MQRFLVFTGEKKLLFHYEVRFFKPRRGSRANSVVRSDRMRTLDVQFSIIKEVAS